MNVNVHVHVRAGPVSEEVLDQNRRALDRLTSRAEDDDHLTLISSSGNGIEFGLTEPTRRSTPPSHLFDFIFPMHFSFPFVRAA